MTPPEHPSPERISDLLAGVLPATEAMDLNIHLASCEVCRDERDALLDLTALLTDEGATSLEMPSDVVASLDAAISRASAERTAGIPMIDPAHRQVGRPASRQPLRWLAGAAAAVVVVGVGFAGLRNLPQAGSDSQADGSSQAGSIRPENRDRNGIPSMVEGGGAAVGGGAVGRSDSGSPTAMPTGANGDELYSIQSESQLRVVARDLAMSPAKAVSPRAQGCAAPLTDGLTSAVRFMGRPAVLTVVRATRLATVYDCATATRTIYLTDY